MPPAVIGPIGKCPTSFQTESQTYMRIPRTCNTIGEFPSSLGGFSELKTHAIRAKAFGCLALPCLAVPCLASPCLALSCLALPCLISSSQGFWVMGTMHSRNLKSIFAQRDTFSRNDQQLWHDYLSWILAVNSCKHLMVFLDRLFGVSPNTSCPLPPPSLSRARLPSRMEEEELCDAGLVCATWLRY